MAAVVQVEDTAPLDVEHLIPNTMGEPGGGMFRPVLIDQQAIFRFEPEDSVEHGGEADRGSPTLTLAFHL